LLLLLLLLLLLHVMLVWVLLLLLLLLLLGAVSRWWCPRFLLDVLLLDRQTSRGGLMLAKFDRETSQNSFPLTIPTEGAGARTAATALQQC
jgi:hypothetical protein